MQLVNRVALVTGAGSGIGRAAALALAHEGARIGALGRSISELEETVTLIRKAQREAIPLVADISQPAAMQAAVEALLERWQRLDIVFANAGINGVWAPVDELSVEDWDKTLEVNLRGTFLTVKYSVPHLKQRGGSIIVTSSINGTRVFSNSGATAYASSKAGQVAFSKMIALELAKHKIRVNAICPGWIETDIDKNTEKRGLEAIQEPVEFPEGAVPLTDGAPGRPEQVAAAVVFLASDAASLITGTELWIDGGESLLQG